MQQKEMCEGENTHFHLVLVFEESHHPWSRDIYEYSDVELI